MCFRAVSSYYLTLDNIQIAKTVSNPTDSACAGYDDPVMTMAVADGLDYGLHTAVLSTVGQGEGPFRFYGGVVTVAVGTTGTNPTQTMIDNADPGWVFEPGGITDLDPGWWSGNLDDSSSGGFSAQNRWTCGYENATSASYVVSGTSVVQLVAKVTNNTNGYTVIFNNALLYYNASNFFTSFKQTLFFVGGLDPSRQYPLTVINFDPYQQNPPEGQSCLNIDALILHAGSPISIPPSLPSVSQTLSSTSPPSISSPTSPSLSPSTASVPPSTSTNVGAVAGGTVCGVIGVLALYLLIYLRLRRRWRRAIVDLAEEPPHGTEESPLTPFIFYAPRTTDDVPLRTGNDRAKVTQPSHSRHPSREALPEPSPQVETQQLAEVPRDALRYATTADMVEILNERLRAEHEINELMDLPDPLGYG